jgi:hypothetical protein
MPFSVDEKYVQETETALGIKFPAAFRKKMIEENGGELTLPEGVFRLYPVRDNADEARSKATENDIITATKAQKRNYTFPNDGIAFAANASGDHLVFIKEYYHSDKCKKGVFFWSANIGFVKRIAEDFSKLP